MPYQFKAKHIALLSSLFHSRHFCLWKKTFACPRFGNLSYSPLQEWKKIPNLFSIFTHRAACCYCYTHSPSCRRRRLTGRLCNNRQIIAKTTNYNPSWQAGPSWTHSFVRSAVSRSCPRDLHLHLWFRVCSEPALSGPAACTLAPAHACLRGKKKCQKRDGQSIRRTHLFLSDNLIKLLQGSKSEVWPLFLFSRSLSAARIRRRSSKSAAVSIWRD